MTTRNIGIAAIVVIVSSSSSSCSSDAAHATLEEREFGTVAR